MKIGFVLFDNYHQRPDNASSRIRGKWLIKYWPEAEEFVQGKDYETVIYQKCYWKEHARAFKGKKILDICDPDWLEGTPVVDFMELMDAITVPTQALKEAIEKFTKVPVYVIKDRIDFSTLPEIKKQTDEKAKSVVWFGYVHNIHVIEPALPLLSSLGLKLIVVTNGNFSTSECQMELIKWELATANENIQKADFALLPVSSRGTYKSENKDILALALGLPVAKTADDLKRLIDPVERKKDIEEKTKTIFTEYDVVKSVEEMKKVIESIKKEA